jgi:hypothetical protein
MPRASHAILLRTLAERFARHPERHPDLSWEVVRERLERDGEALAAIAEMEGSGGEPDVIGRDAATGALLVCDCAAESPAGRRSLCYDDEALDARKEAKPVGSAVGRAQAMGITLLTEEEYAALQRLGPFDRKTSSWLLTPAPLRALGGALFGDHRYGRTFTYHNGAQSYYAARGFRGMRRV